jgi:hypothetical protein
MFIVLFGEVSTGFEAVGPFPSFEAARDYADKDPEAGRIVDLTPPADASGLARVLRITATATKAR